MGEVEGGGGAVRTQPVQQEDPPVFQEQCRAPGLGPGRGKAAGRSPGGGQGRRRKGASTSFESVDFTLQAMGLHRRALWELLLIVNLQEHVN